MSRAVLPPCSLAWDGPVLESVVLMVGYRLHGRNNGNVLQEDLCQHAVPSRTAAASAPDPVASHYQPTCPLWTLTGKSGSVSCGVTAPFSWVLGAQKILLVPSKSLFPQSCGNSVIKSHWLLKLDSLRNPSPFARSQVGKFVVGPTARTSLVNCSPACGLSAWWLYGGTYGDLPEIYATYSASQEFCCQWPCPRSRPLLTHTSAGDPQTPRKIWLSLLWGSLLHSLGPGVHMVLFVPSKSLWQVLGLALKLISPVLPSCWPSGDVHV